MKINWKVRFNAQNKAFITRFVIAVFLPVITYFGLKVTDITSWGIAGKLFVDAVSNPYVLGLALVNAWNVLSDPTTSGFGDSENALTYTQPK